MHNCASCTSVILPEEHVTRLGNGELLCEVCSGPAELLKLRTDPLIDELVRALGELAPRDVLEGTQMKLASEMTRDQRIAEVAWRANDQYSYNREYAERGFSDEELHQGYELAEAMRRERELNCAVYGNPCYGSWPERAKSPIREKICAMMKAPQGAQIEPKEAEPKMEHSRR